MYCLLSSPHRLTLEMLQVGVRLTGKLGRKVVVRIYCTKDFATDLEPRRLLLAFETDIQYKRSHVRHGLEEWTSKVN